MYPEKVICSKLFVKQYQIEGDKHSTMLNYFCPYTVFFSIGSNYFIAFFSTVRNQHEINTQVTLLLPNS